MATQKGKKKLMILYWLSMIKKIKIPVANWLKVGHIFLETPIHIYSSGSIPRQDCSDPDLVTAIA